MGGNTSRVNDGRTHVTSATLVPSTYNNKPSNNNWAPACAPYPTNYKPSNNNYTTAPTTTNNNNYPDYKVHRPSETLSTTATTGNVNRVVAFHSAARWKEYFEGSKYSNKLVVIYFTATWCGPCKYMEPTIKELASKYNDIDIVKIDVDELLNVSREFGVQAMPTFMFMKRGKQIDKVVGAKKEDLQRKIEKHRF